MSIGKLAVVVEQVPRLFIYLVRNILETLITLVVAVLVMVEQDTLAALLDLKCIMVAVAAVARVLNKVPRVHILEHPLEAVEVVETVVVDFLATRVQAELVEAELVLIILEIKLGPELLIQVAVAVVMLLER
jgi:hypothetical protein